MAHALRVKNIPHEHSPAILSQNQAGHWIVRYGQRAWRPMPTYKMALRLVADAKKLGLIPIH